MKKNSFKRFLAVTLAAATALTFAPVSTLGLSGVIEAQAADVSLDKDSEERTAVAGDTVKWAGEHSGTVNVSLGSIGTPEKLTLQLSGGTDKAYRYTISGASSTSTTDSVRLSDTTDTNATRNEGLTSISVDEGTDNNAVSVFTAQNKGTQTVTVTDNMGTADNTSDDKTLTINFTVTGVAENFDGVTFNKVNADKTEEAVPSTGLVVDKNAESETKVNVNFTDETKGDIYYAMAGDESIATVGTQGGHTISTHAIKTHVGDPLEIKGKAKGKTTVYLFKSKSDARAADAVDTNDAVAHFDVIVTDKTVATDIKTDDITMAAGDTKTATIQFSKANTEAKDLQYGTFAAEVTPQSDQAAGDLDVSDAKKVYIDEDGKASFDIKAKASASGEYTVKIKKDASTDLDTGTTQSFKVTVTGAELAVTKTTDIVAGKDAGIFAIQTPGETDVYKVAILSGSTDVTSDFDLYQATDSTVLTSRLNNTGNRDDGAKARDNVANFAVKAGSSVSAGTYTVKVIDETETESAGKEVAKTATFKVTSDGEAPVVKASNTINAAPQDDVILTDKTTYNLVENVTIKYNGVVYPASQLTWYLTNDLSAEKYHLGDEIKALALKTDANASLDAGEGELKAGKGVLTLSVNDAEKASDKLWGEDYHIAATASINGRTTLVYFDTKAFTPYWSEGKTQVVNATVSTSPSAAGLKNDSFLDGQRIYNPSQENYYLDAAHFNLDERDDAASTNQNNFAVKMTDDYADGYYVLKKSTITGPTADLASGVYYETVYQTYNKENVIKLVVAVSVNAGPKGHISDGKYVYDATDGTTKNSDDTLYLDLKQNKTFSIPDHFTSDTPNTTLKYDTNSANVTVDSKGVITAVREGTCDVKVTPTANGIDGTPLYIHVQVNANPFNTFTVTEEKNTSDKATVLNEKDFKNNLVGNEEQLVTKQIDYVEVFVTGNETQNVTETPVVTPSSKANLTYSFYEKSYNDNGLTIDPKTGKITIDYAKIKSGAAELYGHNVYAVKVVADATNDAAQTTGYFYVVVDYPDQKISGIVTDQDYIVGACAKSDTHATAVDLYDQESGKTAKNFKAIPESAYYDFVGDLHYDKDSISSYDETLTTNGQIKRAYAADKTMHVLAYNEQKVAEKAGYTAEIVSFKSAAADDNYVSKIVNKETGEVLYDHSVNAGDTARELKIDKTTTIQVTLAHPVASVASGSAVTLSIKDVNSKSGDIINQNRFITAVKNTKDVDVALYPNEKGTQVIEVGPGGHLTKTNRTDIHQNSVKIAVTYTGEASADAKNPAQVKGVKVSNKKGAKVTVTFNKITANSTMRYYVQKKVGKKVSGKSIGSTKTTLSVKKGATVKVRVKAYYYDANGVKHVGKYSAWKTLKTDKK